jgi:hypothetical protein
MSRAPTICTRFYFPVSWKAHDDDCRSLHHDGVARGAAGGRFHSASASSRSIARATRRSSGVNGRSDAAAIDAPEKGDPSAAEMLTYV